MSTEQDKMLRGDLYDPFDPQLVAERRRARSLLKALNDSKDGQQQDRLALVRELLGQVGEGIRIEPPFFCDYGGNIAVGDGVFFNFNCVVLDVASVTIGSRVLFGPAVQLYAAAHPMRAATRAEGLELGQPVTIGDDVWIGGGAIVCPGVRIGARSVIGAGSVVTSAIPDDVFAAGNPCRMIRRNING